MNDQQFKRLTGVTRETFSEMVSVYKEHLAVKAASAGIGGRKPKLTPEERTLILLGYYREYRTYMHISLDYGVSESVVCRTIQEVESIPKSVTL